MNYFDSEQQLIWTLEELLASSELSVNKFIDEIYSISNPKELILEEIGIIFEQIKKIITKEKHRDQLFEMLEENFDWPREMTKEIASELDDRVLSPLQKYIRTQNERPQPQVNEAAKPYVPLQNSEIPDTHTPPQTQAQITQSQFQPEEDQRNEIERLKEKILRLEEGKSQYAPQPQPQQNQAPREEPKRFGIEPAEDLGTADFDWRGNVGGVEIEKEQEEIENEENLDKATILEEVENPPVYSSFSPLEEKLQRAKQVNNGSTETNTTEPKGTPKEETTTNFSNTDTNDKEEERSKAYKGGDPYREPIE